ncbi:MAG: ATP-binding cassette domain-containing protein [Gemmatimonadaceae bacterium]|nr:ATP-binding cassette domain-containing protein [Gemmatimonadaceae bacterium]MCW5826987.1 ATP-binding cassette domain-containing protein [Gemmatimonadaceae bacterium]
MSAAALALHDIHKRFGETQALAGASCVVRAGTVHALLGENGAGKTTLMRIAFGMLAPDAGQVACADRRGPFVSEREAIAAGIGMVHQHFMLVPALSVAENVALGGRGPLRPDSVAERVRTVSERMGLHIDPAATVRDLPVGAQQRAELVRALARDARVVILDEPTAVLTPSESDELYRWMRRFAADGGSVVLVTHKVREALAVADDVTVLRRGRTVLTGTAAALGEADVLEAIVGTAIATTDETPLPSSSGEVVFALEAATVADDTGVVRLHPTTLTVRRGEILGVLGVEGAGQRELLRLLAGRLAPSSGRVHAPARVGFVPEDRLHDAVIPEFTLTENRALAGAGARRGWLDWHAEREAARAIIDDFGVRTAGEGAAMRTLSGGNQQRFVVGRERQIAPDALVAENPTRGLDVRATAQVLATIRAVAREQNGAAVVHSSDLDEIVSLTQRVVVCFGGTVREVAPPAQPGDREPYARALVGALA